MPAEVGRLHAATSIEADIAVADNDEMVRQKIDVQLTNSPDRKFRLCRAVAAMGEALYSQPPPRRDRA
jgi:hypothetical protein